MTNETTASQPCNDSTCEACDGKGAPAAPVSDKELHDALDNIAMKKSAKIDGQPKSIGDDEAFIDKLVAVQLATDEAAEARYDEMIAYLDSKLRAPADQASATIQAAPEELTYTVDGEVMSQLEYIDYLHGEITTAKRKTLEFQRVADERRLQIGRLETAVQRAATIQAAPEGWTVEFDKYTLPGTIRLSSPKWGGCFLGKPTSSDTVLSSLMYRYFADLLATIQEPVMVAEPVDVLREALDLAATWIENIKPEELELWRDVKAADIRRVLRAAPMVADPAGVAVDKLPVHYVEGLENGGYYLCTDVIRVLAATVKAVPSEAVEGCEHCLHTYCLSSEICRHCGDVNGTQGYKGGKLAAPLADKTGGGE